MKKIIISLSIIGVVAAVIIGGTIAFFSDTETSTGNTFTAGAIDLKIDNESYVTNPETGELMFNQGTSWELNDLTNELFFNFVDLKPGDIGEDTISLHVNSNDAWACMSINITETPENDCTEPEDEVDEVGAVGCGETNDGEFQDELYFAFWADDGDNVYEDGEVIFEEGLATTLFDGTNWALADSTRNIWTGHGPIPGGNDPSSGLPYTYYIGKVWCYGELIPVPLPPESGGTPLTRGTGFTCSGAQVSNESQTDGIMADVTFYAEQSRNNPNFTCVQPIYVLSSQMNYNGAGGWAGWSCPANHTVVDGGYLPANAVVAVSMAWKPGASVGVYTYPTTPFGYPYTDPEEGWIVQDGGAPGADIPIEDRPTHIYLWCLPN